jgi:hypothetical protein
MHKLRLLRSHDFVSANERENRRISMSDIRASKAIDIMIYKSAQSDVELYFTLSKDYSFE